MGSGTDYMGSITVGTARYSSISFDSGNYTMSGVSGTDTGTYTANRAARTELKDGTYTLISSTHGTFTVTLSANTLSFSGGASGSATDATGVTPEALPASSGDDPFDGKEFSGGSLDENDKLSGIDSSDDRYAFEDGWYGEIYLHTTGEKSLRNSPVYKYSYSGNTFSRQLAIHDPYNYDSIQAYLKALADKGASPEYLWTEKRWFERIRKYTVTKLEEAGYTIYKLTSLFPGKISDDKWSYGGDYNANYYASLGSAYGNTNYYYYESRGSDTVSFTVGDQHLACRIIGDDGSRLELAVVGEGSNYSFSYLDRARGYMSATYSLSSADKTCSLTVTDLSEGFDAAFKQTYTFKWSPSEMVFVLR